MSSAESIESLLAAIVTECNDENTEAIALGGSYARGTATRYSDVDIALFVSVLPDRYRKHYIFRDGYMVNYSMKSLAQERLALLQPERAIFLVPSYRDMRILLDNQGSLAEFMRKVYAFTWEPLQSAANAHASYRMMIEAEFPFKILSALQQENHAALAYETMNLLHALTEIMAVKRGVLVQTNSTYMQQVEQSLGLQSPWTRYHRLAAGLDEIVSPWSALTVRGLAILLLFIETAQLLDSVLLPDHREVVQTTERTLNEFMVSRYPLSSYVKIG